MYPLGTGADRLSVSSYGSGDSDVLRSWSVGSSSITFHDSELAVSADGTPSLPVHMLYSSVLFLGTSSTLLGCHCSAVLESRSALIEDVDLVAVTGVLILVGVA